MEGFLFLLTFIPPKLQKSTMHLLMLVVRYTNADNPVFSQTRPSVKVMLRLAETGLEVRTPVSKSSCQALEHTSLYSILCSASARPLLALPTTAGELPQLKAAHDLMWSIHPLASWTHRHLIFPHIPLESSWNSEPSQPGPKTACLMRSLLPLQGQSWYQDPHRPHHPNISLLLSLIRPVCNPSFPFTFLYCPS